MTISHHTLGGWEAAYNTVLLCFDRTLPSAEGGRKEAASWGAAVAWSTTEPELDLPPGRYVGIDGEMTPQIAVVDVYLLSSVPWGQQGGLTLTPWIETVGHAFDLGLYT